MDNSVWTLLQRYILLAVTILFFSACLSLETTQEVDVVGTFSTVAGTGESSFSGDGGPAPKAKLEGPISLAIDPSGNLYIGEYARIRKVDREGHITTVAGNGVPGFSGDGIPSIEAKFNSPHLRFDAEGNLWVLNHFQPCLRKIDPSGVITRIAGTGIEGSIPEDGAQARDVAICGVPYGPAIDSDGSAYISCEFGHVVLKIDSEGFIYKFAGTGEPGFSGDDGPAREAQLFSPLGMAFDSEGNLYIADGLNSRIRKVDKNGIISTVAGTGIPGYSGDGGPAMEAEIATPLSIAVDREGNIFFTSHSNKVVRKIDTDGIIHTVAGGGKLGILGDGSPATEESFKGAGLEIAIDTEGNLYIADDGDHRVRKVTLVR
jgi:DNA-binding beta-propeller fold protein YncE